MKKLTPEEFIDMVIQLGKANGYSISHEDCGGAFRVVDFNPENAEWLRQALIETISPRLNPTIP